MQMRTFYLPPFGRITGIRFYGYNLSPCIMAPLVGKSSFIHDQNEKMQDHSEHG
jgi:hypothetical protein